MNDKRILFLAIAVVAFLGSVSFSMLYVVGLATSTIDAVVNGAVVLLLQLALVFFTGFLSRSWGDPDNFRGVVGWGLLVVVCLGVSQVTGVCYLNQGVDAKQQERLAQSDARKSAIHARDNANSAAQQAATSRGESLQAEADLRAARGELAAAIADGAKWMTADGRPRTDKRGAPFITRAAPFVTRVNAANARIRESQRITGGYARYMALNNRAAALMAKPLPGIDEADARLSVFERVRPYLIPALLDIICVIFSGLLAREMGGSRVIPAARVVPALHTGGRIQAGGVAELHDAEAVLNAQAVAHLDSTSPGLIDRLNNGQFPERKKGVCQHCQSVFYMARSGQKYCPGNRCRNAANNARKLAS